jgi:hypothetical protein
MIKKKVYKQWTVKSFDLDKFDDEINSNLEIGWEIVEGSYLIRKVDGKKMISQVLVWKDDDDENLHLNFNINTKTVDVDNGQISNELMSIKRKLYHRDKKHSRTHIKWYKKNFGEKYLSEKTIYFNYVNDVSDIQKRKKYHELKNGDGKILELNEYNDDGTKHGRYINYNLEGNYNNGEPDGTWIINNTYFGQIFGQFLHYRNENITEKDGYIFFDKDLMEKIYREQKKEKKLEKRRVVKKRSETSTSEWTQEESEIIHKSYVIFEDTDYGYIPTTSFNGSIQLRTRKYDDSDNKSLGIQVDEGKILNISGYGYLGMTEELKIERFVNPDDEFDPKHVITERIKYCKKNESEHQKYVVKKFNKDNKNIRESKIFFPKTLREDKYLDSSKRICVEKFFTGEDYNKPKGVWKRYFPDGRINLSVEYNEYLDEENFTSFNPKREFLFEKKIKYYDSNGVLRFESLSIISTPKGFRNEMSYNERILKIVEEKSYGEENEEYDILFFDKIKLEDLYKVTDTIDYIRLNNQSLSITGIFEGFGSYKTVNITLLIFNEYYNWDQKGNKIEKEKLEIDDIDRR